MMRRSRLSVKPNFKPDSRTGTEGEQASQATTAADDTSKDEELAKPTQSYQQNMTLEELSEDVGVKETPEMPSETHQNDGAPSSGAATSSTASHRRMRISAAPKLVRPKLSSTPRAQTCARMPSLAASTPPNKKNVHDSASEAQVSVISNRLSKPRTPTKSTSTTELSSTISHTPCVPFTSGLRQPQVSGKNAVEDSPPSPQPGQVPQQPPQEPISECLDVSASDLPLASNKPSRSDKTGASEMSEKSSDKGRILRALKLKELMKIERKKDIQKEKRKVGHKEYTAVDRSKMTMRDLLYYLPNTSPMRSSVECEENPEETVIPPSPKQQIKTAEKDEEEEEEGSENDEMLMPRVRVAEDGSIILDEESLTVRVQRTSDNKITENSTTLFERGNTTMYSSFKKLNYVKSWSVRETDLFFLAISMVGTDFSLIGQLLTHRSRAAIKSKFKKEERVNPWRVDKAFRNKRPFDKEFFSYLLEKVLAKDKDKRKSIKLVLPKTRKPRKSKGKTPTKTFASEDEEEENDDDNIFHMDDDDLEDDRTVSVEKESEPLSNVKEANTPARKRRKRTIDNSKSEDKDGSFEEQVKRKRQRKRSKNTREVQSEEDSEGEGNLNGSINVNKVDELKTSTKKVRRRKHSKGDEEKQNEKPVKRRKESVCQHEESSNLADEGSATKKKGKQAKNIDLDGDVPVTGKKNRKRKKTLRSTVMEEVTEDQDESLADLHDAEQLNILKKEILETSAEIEKGSQDEDNHESILTAADSPLEDERLQMKAVVLLEKTPPRQRYLLSPSKVKRKNNEPEPLMNSPSSSESSSTQQSRMRRAGRVKRDLSTDRKTVRKTGSMDQDEPVSESPMVLLESITRESEDEDDNSLNENLIDLSCLRDLDSQVFQRRPMVVLSREEVDMILNASDQSADEDPSVSPLDLSLNTELSFPFQCSKLLEDTDEGDGVKCMLEENERGTNVSAFCEPTYCERLELSQSASAQPDICILGDNSTTLKPEVCSPPEVGLSKVHRVAPEDVTVVAAVLEVPPPVILLKNVDPICMKLEAPMTKETITSEAATLSTQSVVSDFTKESEKAMLPSLSKEESELDSSESTVQSKPTSVESGLGSRRPLQAAKDVTAELQKSLERPFQTLETLQDISESKEDTPQAGMGSPEIKARTQSCAFGLEVTEDSQEEVQSRPTRRSRFLKPKPNLSQKSRVLQSQPLKTPSTLKPESTESTGSTEKPYSLANDQQDAFENFSKQNLTKEEGTSQADAMDRMESESTKDLSDASPAVTDQENMTKVALSPSSATEPQKALEWCSSRCDVDMIPTCTPSRSSRNAEDTGSEQMIIPSEDVCAAAETVHLTDDAHNDEEPTFILTLYEIPVTEAYLPLSSNDPAMVSDLPIVETQVSLGFSDPAHSLPSTSKPSSIDPVQPQSNLGIVTKDLSENGEKGNSANASHYITSQHTKDEHSDPSASLEMGISPFDPHSNSSEFAPLDLAPSIHSTPSGFSISQCITEVTPDLENTEKCDSMLLGDVFVPVSEEMGDDSSKGEARNVECKLERSEDSTVSVTEDLAEKAKQHFSKMDTKDEEDDAGETSVLIKNTDSECKIGSEFAPLEDSSSSAQSTSSGTKVSKCITLHQDSSDMDTEQCESVSHKMLGDIFVPVSEELEDDLSKDREMAVECKLESSEASTISVTEVLAENVKEQISKELTSQETILLDTKDESNASVNEPHSECKNGSEIAPCEHLPSRIQSTASRFNVSKGITLHADSEDTEQCERVSHVLLGDVFVPVLEGLGDDLSRTKVVEYKEASIVSPPERQAAPIKELKKVENLPSVSCLDSTEESKCTTPLSEKTKAPPRERRQRERRRDKPQPKLVKRACAKVDLSKTAEVSKGPNQPTFSHIILPASNEENLPGISNPTTEQSEKKWPIRGHEAKPQSDLEAMETKSITTAVNLSKEPKLDQEKIKNVMDDTSVKKDMESSAKDEPLSISTSSESANVQTSCEAMHSNLLKSSGSGPSTVDSVETKTKTQGVSHMMLPDVFVLVSDVMKDNLSNDWTASMESSPQQELKDVSQPYIEASTQNQLLLEETKTPVRKRAGKQEVKRTCTKNDSPKTKLCPRSPQATSSTQLPTLPQTDNMLLLEEKLQKKHHIMPCSVKLSSLDTVAQSASQLGDSRSNDKSIVISSPTCHVNLMTVSEEASTPSLLSGMTLEDPEQEKKSPTRNKGKKKESSPDIKHGHLKPVQDVSQTRQLTVTDWVNKRSSQTVTNQQEKQPVKQSSLKAKEKHQLMVEKTCLKLQRVDLKEPKVSYLAPTLEETKEINSASTVVKRLSEVDKDLTEDPSVAQVKTTPLKRRSKLSVKPTLAKRVCTEINISASDQQRPTRFTSPTRQHVQAAREKEEPNKYNTSSVEQNVKCKGSPLITSGPLSPKSQDVWPKVVLPRVKVDATEAGICAASSTPTSSPARVLQSTSLPVTPPQMKKSPTQSSSPAANENLNADPARVSQFFVSDIFTEVNDAD